MASILSATDPVAVVSVLHTLGAPPRLSTLIAGEALLNDGSAYVFFVVFYELSSHVCRDQPAVYYIGNFFRLALGGPAIGITVRRTTKIHYSLSLHSVCGATHMY